MLTRKLEQTLHNEIPLTKAMGISVVSYDGHNLRMQAPLEPNVNHKSTAFGGSLYSVAVLCGWGMLHLKLEEAGMHKHIVIQEANIQYLLPVDEILRAECRLEDADWQKFMRTLLKHGRARISLDVVMHEDGQPAVQFSGRYVVHS